MSTEGPSSHQECDSCNSEQDVCDVGVGIVIERMHKHDVSVLGLDDHEGPMVVIIEIQIEQIQVILQGTPVRLQFYADRVHACVVGENPLPCI
jgi:hypothetical protein